MTKVKRIPYLSLVLVLVASVWSFEVNALGRDSLSVRLPDVPAPDGASWYWVSKQMAYNGMPMSIKMFEYAGTEEALKSFYRRRWQIKGHGQFAEKDLGLYKILSHDLRGIYVTVQYRHENGFLKGKIVVSESPGKRFPNKKSRLPIPPTAKIASKVETRDEHGDSESLTLESHKSVDFNKRYYENQLDYDDWKLVYESGDGYSSVVQHYQKHSQLLQITIKSISGIDKNRCQILLHWVK